ncbi:MAG: FHA domain-containing protein, partial [Gammaproteobacteria bacterium]
MSETKLPGNEFCRQTFFGHRHTPTPLARKKHDVMEDIQSGAGLKGDLGLRRLFQGLPLNVNPGDKLTVWKNGIAVHEIPLAQMGKETVIGRHPTVDLQLESYKLALFHAVIFQSQGKYFVESLDLENGTLLNRRRLKLKSPVQLRDGAQVDIPGYRLEFAIADAPPLDEEQDEPDTEVLDDIPVFFYTPPPPPASPLLVNLIENREQLGVWSEGVTTVKVVDIIEETHDTKTF